MKLKIIFPILLALGVGSASLAESCKNCTTTVTDTGQVRSADPGATSGDDTSAQLSSISAATAVASSLTAHYNAQSSAAVAKQNVEKAQLGSVSAQSDYSNDIVSASVTASDEARMLVSVELKAAASSAASDIDKKLSSNTTLNHILIVNSPAELDVSNSKYFGTVQDAVESEFAQLTQDKDAADQAYAATLKPKKAVPAPAPNQTNRIALLGAVDTILSTGKAIASYTSNVVGYSGISVSIDQSDVPTYVAAELMSQDTKLSVGLPADLGQSDISNVRTELTTLRSEYLTAVAAQAIAKTRSATLKSGSTAESAQAASLYDATDADATALIAEYTGLLTWLKTTPDKASVPNIVTVVNEERIVNSLNEKLVVVVANADPFAAGYTQKSIWSGLTGPAIYAMGGVSLKYRAYRYSDGAILASGVVVARSGYQKRVKSKPTIE